MAYYTDERKYFEELYLHGYYKKILFEGDSWFSIPDIANIPIQLDAKLDLSILCIADPGGTLDDVCGGSQYKKFEHLIHDNRYGQKWDAIMLSLGGNDVIGPEIKNFLLNPGNDSSNPVDYINNDEISIAFNGIKNKFVLIKKLRDNSIVNKNTPVFIHTYNYLTPRNLAHKIFAWKISGPWVWPYMKELGINDPALQRGIVMLLLDKFFTLLSNIEMTAGSNFHIIDIRKAIQTVSDGLVDESFSYWRDEIHPSSKGFSIMVDNFFIPTLKNFGVV